MVKTWIKRWLYTTDHKDVGILYFVTSFYFGFLAALLALFMRTQLAVPNNKFLGAAEYNQAVTMHGLLMVFWFLSPLGIAFANYFIPPQIGAKDLAFPRLNALSYWLYAFGGLVTFIGFFSPGGAANAGWTNYSPLTSIQFSPNAGETLAAAGLIIVSASVTVGTINILTTILFHRAPGMTFMKMPMFTWFIFFTMLQMLWSFPSLLAGLIMLESDRLLGTMFFTSVAGGSILWDNVFWFFGHPEVYVVLLPAIGAVMEIFQVFSNRALYAKKVAVGAGFAIVAISFMIYGHHMFLTGINVTEQEVFTINTETVSIPFGALMVIFIATMYRSAVKLATPMLFGLGSLAIFVIGGLTGVFNSSLALDIAQRGTFFVVGHFHYVMVGASLFGLFGATYYWWPKMTGKMLSESLGKLHFTVSIIGFNLIFFPMFFLMDMPRRIVTYTADTGWGPLNLLASIGAYIFIFGHIIFLTNLLRSFARGPPAGPNPWNGTTLEWTSWKGGGPSPIGVAASSIGRPLLSSLSADPHSVRSSHETVGSEIGHQHWSSRPIELSLGLAVALAGLGFGFPIFVLGLVILAWALVGWVSDDLHDKFMVPDEPPGNRWPFQTTTKLKLGMWAFISSEFTFFGVLLGSYAFVRYNFSYWPPPGSIHNIPIAGANTIILLTSGLTMLLAVQSIKAGAIKHVRALLGSTLLLGSVFMIIKGSEWYDLLTGSPPFTPQTGLPGSTFFVITGIHGAHVIAGLVALVYLLVRTRNGWTPGKRATVEHFGLYWAFVDMVWVFVFPLLYLI